MSGDQVALGDELIALLKRVGGRLVISKEGFTVIRGGGEVTYPDVMMAVQRLRREAAMVNKAIKKAGAA